MAIIDEHGNKISQPQVSKKDKSQMKREVRIMQRELMNPSFCDRCGFRVRSLNHQLGRHHVLEVERRKRR